MDGPDLDAVRARLAVFGELVPVDRSWTALRAATAPEIDLALAPHRRAMHRWLNAWGCRIRNPRSGEPDLFDVATAAWWGRHRRPLERLRRPLAGLTDADVMVVAGSFGELSAAVVAVDARGHGRTMGPTAAAKCLYALRPRSVMPWDMMIARRLHAGRDEAAFAAHLRLGRRWAKDLLDASGLDEEHLVAALDRPGASLAKVLDEYCYVRYTLDR